jgi:hypothetical protein
MNDIHEYYSLLFISLQMYEAIYQEPVLHVGQTLAANFVLS